MKAAGRTAIAFAALMMTTAATQVVAADEWEIGVTPYLWVTGIDGKFNINGRSANANVDFADLLDNMDIGGSALLEANRGHWVSYIQFDYMALDVKDVEVGPLDAEIKVDSLMFAGATGYRFQTGERSTMDVLLGVRALSMDTELQLVGPLGNTNAGDGKATNYDAMIALRPRLSLSKWWTFSPTMSIGAGDSDLVWEMSPQVEYSHRGLWNLRMGYRSLNYDLGSGNNSADITISGPMIGFGWDF